jgi:hypothetical protein
MKAREHSLRMGALLLCAAIGVAGCQSLAPVETAATQEEMVAKGEYLVTVMGCNDCHTPWKMEPNGPEPDMTRMLSGHPEGMTLPPPPQFTSEWPAVGSATFTAWAGPWGITYAANLTPDDNTGIGIWDEAMFIKTIRDGRHMGDGRPIQPPMPWLWYSKLTDEDLKAMFAYLESIPPIVNLVPDYEPPAESH